MCHTCCTKFAPAAHPPFPAPPCSYVATQACTSAWNALVGMGLAAPIPYGLGAPLLFGAGVTVVLQAFMTHPHLLRPSYVSLLEWML